jgi:oxygen-independent coproporphyrinogen-3 oxidase
MTDLRLPAARRLYIHVPFCTRKCGYCAFKSEAIGDPGATGAQQLFDAYLGGLERELDLRREALAALPLDSVFFGGGTPGLLGPRRVQRFLDRLAALGLLDAATEITLEANPETLGPAAAWKAAGVRRLSLGVQSLDNGVLQFLGRPHDRDLALAALADGVASGLPVNADLIIAVPGVERQVPQEIRTLASLGLAHFSVYVLGLEEGTPLARRLEQAGGGRALDASCDGEAEALMEARDTLLDLGFLHYEISNYARSEDQRCRHNLGYWNHQSYLGLGPAAHSFLQTSAGPCRSWNHSSLRAWLADLQAGLAPVEGQETLTKAELVLERLMLGLRQTQGLSLATLKTDFGLALPPAAPALKGLLDLGLLELDAGTLRPSPAGMLQADGLAATLSDLLV